MTRKLSAVLTVWVYATRLFVSSTGKGVATTHSRAGWPTARTLDAAYCTALARHTSARTLGGLLLCRHPRRQARSSGRSSPRGGVSGPVLRGRAGSHVLLERRLVFAAVSPSHEIVCPGTRSRGRTARRAVFAARALRCAQARRRLRSASPTWRPRCSTPLGLPSRAIWRAGCPRRCSAGRRPPTAPERGPATLAPHWVAGPRRGRRSSGRARDRGDLKQLKTWGTRNSEASGFAGRFATRRSLGEGGSKQGAVICIRLRRTLRYPTKPRRRRVQSAGAVILHPASPDASPGREGRAWGKSTSTASISHYQQRAPRRRVLYPRDHGQPVGLVRGILPYLRDASGYLLRPARHGTAADPTGTPPATWPRT